MPVNILSKDTSASVKELFILTTPIFISLLSSNLMLFCDRYFLSRYSFEAFKAVGVASYLVALFQIICIRFTTSNQVFVGTSFGNNSVGNIGIYTWQMIWASLLSIFLTFPISIVVEKLYFSNTEIRALGEAYFSIMMIGNFLFPLGTTLAAFFLGIGNTKVLSLVAFISNLLNAALDYCLINGIPKIFDPLGIKGAAIATLISQGIYCTILFFLFINHPNRKEYRTRDFYFRASFFKECFKVGTPNAISRLISLSFWALSMKIVASKGGDYITLISFGSTICLLISIVRESISRGLMTFFSYFLGQNNWKYVWKSLRSGVILLIVIFFLLALPFIFYNDYLIEMVIGSKITNIATMNLLRLACYWLWIFFLLEGIVFFIINLLMSMKETMYLLKINALMTYFTVYLPFYLGFGIGNLGADKIWMITWINFIPPIYFYVSRIFKHYKNSMVSPSQKNFV